MAIQFQDFSIKVKGELNDLTRSWLHETANEIKAQAQRNCQMTGDDHGQLKASYESKVDEGAGSAQVGSALESAYWEEWGTGEYAAHGDGRKGWWIYVKGAARGDGGKTYKQDEAQAMAASMRQRGLDAYATNGREPNYTLEKAFKQTKAKAISALAAALKERMGSA